MSKNFYFLHLLHNKCLNLLSWLDSFYCELPTGSVVCTLTHLNDKLFISALFCFSFSGWAVSQLGMEKGRDFSSTSGSSTSCSPTGDHHSSYVITRYHHRSSATVYIFLWDTGRRWKSEMYKLKLYLPTAADSVFIAQSLQTAHFLRL